MYSLVSLKAFNAWIAEQKKAEFVNHSVKKIPSLDEQ